VHAFGNDGFLPRRRVDLARILRDSAGAGGDADQSPVAVAATATAVAAAVGLVVVRVQRRSQEEEEEEEDLCNNNAHTVKFSAESFPHFFV
jgi:hypothetical protein